MQLATYCMQLATQCMRLAVKMHIALRVPSQLPVDLHIASYQGVYC